MIEREISEVSKMTQAGKSGSSASKYALDSNPQLAQLNPNHGTWERIEELVKLMKERLKNEPNNLHPVLLGLTVFNKL